MSLLRHEHIRSPVRYARSRMDRRAREDHSKVEQAAHRVDERCFENPSLKAFSRSYLVPSELLLKLKGAISSSLHQLEELVYSGDQSVYTGSAGLALLHLQVAHRLHGDEPATWKQHLESALRYLEPCLKELGTRRVTFLCGAAGPLAVAACLYHMLGDSSKSQRYVSQLKELVHVPATSDLPYEVLYGHAGYLYALLFVGELVPGGLDESLVEQEVMAILDAGESGGRSSASRSPLMFTWHGKRYLGAAHGLAGILTVLLQVKVDRVKQRILKLVEPCVDYLISLCFPSGNFPSSIESMGYDRLVQWCHGAPGLVHLLAHAYRVFGKKSYLKAALRCGDVVWERGLLLKGYSICHGVAGNGYTFLQLYRLTQDNMHLHRAAVFAEWCLSSDTRQCSRTPDRPYSMFEGLAGVTYYYCDMLAPEKATFPALELWIP